MLFYKKIIYVYKLRYIIIELYKYLCIRCLHLLTKRFPETLRHLYARYLVAICLLERKQHDECIKVLRDTDTTDEADAAYLPRLSINILDNNNSNNSTQQQQTQQQQQQSNNATSSSTSSSSAQRQRLLAEVCLLRGRAFVGLETRLRAIYWLRRALQLDPYCSEAFLLLTERRVLSVHSEARLTDALCASLPSQQDAWLRDFYVASLQRDGAVSIRADANARRAIIALGGTSTTTTTATANATAGIVTHGLDRSADVLATRAQVR